MGEMPLIGGGNSGGSLKDPPGRQDEPENGRVHLPLRGPSAFIHPCRP